MVPEIMGQKLVDGLLVICDITVVDLGKRKTSSKLQMDR